MGLTIEDLLHPSTQKEGMGISLEDLMNVQTTKHLELEKWLDKNTKWLDVNNCYVIDIESFNLNSQIRMIQILNTKSKTVYLLVNGKTSNFNVLLLKLALKQENMKLIVKFGNSEKEIVEYLLKLLYLFPKKLLGQNLTHFDLGLINAKIQKYKLLEIYKVYLKFYNVGKSSASKHICFSYHLGEVYQKLQKRYAIVDTMFIAQTLTIPSSLRELSQYAKKLENSEWRDYPKKEVKYKYFEREKLPLSAILYSIYDILSIPKVYLYLKSIIYETTMKYLKIDEKASQLICEHIWMKGAGALSKVYMLHFLGRINPSVPDFYTKYYGGLCRVWSFECETSKGIENNTIRQFDFTSAYAFAIVKQGIFDILNGDFEFYHNQKIEEKDYEELIYSSIIELKCMKSIKLLYEIDTHKTKGLVSIGYLRSFDKTSKVSDLEHSFGFLYCIRGEKIILTKTELEMNKLLNENLFEFVKIQKVKFGLKAIKREKSLEYIELFKIRQILKEIDNPSEYSIKQILASSYGQLVNADSDFFHLACGSSIPAFQRFQIFAICIKSRKLGLKNVYSDTDSLYVKGNLRIMNQLMKYANTLNEYPKLLYNVENLKDEGENILCFHAIKRKRYIKVYYDKKGKLKIKVKGENGNSDYRWRDIFFRLSMITEGSLTLQEIQKHIENKNFGFGFPTKPNIFQLNEEKQQLKKQIRQLRKDMKKFPLIDEEGISKYYQDDIEEIKEDLITENEGYLLKIGDMYKDSNSMFQDIEYRKERIKEIDEIINHNFLGLFKNIYKKYREELVTKLIPELDSKAKITMMYNTHFKMSVNYENGIYYDKIRKAWENRTGEKAYIGCFFSINRLLLKEIMGNEVFWLGSFQPKDAKDFSFQFNVSTYLTDCDVFPFILNREINEILHQKIELDTITLKTGDVIPLWILDNEISREFTDKSFKFGHSKVVIHKLLSRKAILLRLRLKDSNFERKNNLNLDIIKYGFHEKYDFEKYREIWNKNLPYIEILRANSKKAKQENEDYANTTLMFSNIIHYKALVRFNKFRLFCKNTTLFNVYYTIDKLAKLMQFTLEKMFEINGLKVELPRFRMIRQIDVSHPSSEEFHKKLYHLIYNIKNKNIINDFIQVDIMSYASLTCYNKKLSAERILELKNLSDKEREYLEREKEEGYRTEIKFSLQRTIYETMNYLFLLQIIDKNYFLQFLEKIQKIHQEKQDYFEFKSFLSGYFKFAKDECIILFIPEIYRPQNIEYYNQEMLVDLLEGRGWIKPPPLISQDVSEKLFEEKIEKFQKKILDYRQNKIKWKLDEIIINDNSLETKIREDKIINDVLFRY